MPLDLSTFRPGSAGDLLNGILAALLDRLGVEWTRVKRNATDGLRAVAAASFRTQQRLAEGTISRAQADLLLHGQELAANQVMAQAELATYELAQAALDTVFAVITAGIRNVTGIQVFRL